jgi:putative (di)nucleoside polyphosphate hydrolase
MPPITKPSTLPYRPCAGIVLVNAEGLVFAGRRLDTSSTEPSAWQMPQGGIDAGETPDVAAFREMEEEIGTRNAQLLGQTPEWIAYDLPPHLLGKVWKGKYRGQKQKWFAFKFQGADGDINIDTEHPEFSDWTWMEASKLLERTVEFKRHVYEEVFKEFKGFLR